MRVMLVVLGLLLISTPATAATYTLEGDGTCFFQGADAALCTARGTFSVDPADYGKTIPLLAAGLIELFQDGDLVGSGSFLWSEDDGEPGECTDACAEATTSVEGDLLRLAAHCFNCVPDIEANYRAESGIGGWKLFGALPPDLEEAVGSWTLVVTPVPLPATLPLSLAVFGLLFGLGRGFRRAA